MSAHRSTPSFANLGLSRARSIFSFAALLGVAVLSGCATNELQPLDPPDGEVDMSVPDMPASDLDNGVDMLADMDPEDMTEVQKQAISFQAYLRASTPTTSTPDRING